MHVRRLSTISLAASISLWAVPAAAQGQDGANIELNAFRPAIDSRGFVTVNASSLLGHGELSFGLVTNWGYNVLSFENGQDQYEVQNIISPTFVGAVGLEFGPIGLEFGLSMPFPIVFGDRSPDDFGEPGNTSDDRRFQFDGQGLGDIGLHLKTRFLNASRGPKIGLAVIGSLYLPTASEKDKWIGEDSLVPQVMGVLDKEFGELGRLRVALSGGIRLRLDTVEFVDNNPNGVPMLPATGDRVEAGSTVPFGAAIAYSLVPQKIDLVAEVFGAAPLGGENFFPLEAIGAIKVYLAKNSYFSIGGGTGLIRGQGANPDARAFLSIIHEPRIGDRDGDGIKDDIDQCAGKAEDYDDFEDEDGCPDLDNDRDGILDDDDKCPNVPEDKDGFEDDDGCPEGNENDRDGDGILDDEDNCPDEAEDFDGFQDEDGCPDTDNDQDGILDVEDLCPDDPEDQDGWEDEDGCPDTDNDKDRILDEDDKCPLEPETYNGTEDEDGCPDRGRVVVTDTNIEILDKVYFEFNSAVIKPKSFPILDAVAQTLEGNPDILQVEIQGHTDERGSESYNLRLSDERANSVRQYLVDKGIGPARLEAQGYGESEPIDRRHNEAAWKANRRVEFLIVKRSND